MNYSFSKSPFSKLWLRSIIYLLIIIISIVLQISFLHLISIQGFLPDILLIIIAWISLYEGRFYGLIAGFLAGILFDLSGEDILGSNALIKSIAAFVAGSFYSENKKKDILSGFRFLVAVILASLINNFIYYLIYMDIRDFNLKNFFVQDILASSVYTSVIALIPMFFSSRIRN